MGFLPLPDTRFSLQWPPVVLVWDVHSPAPLGWGGLCPYALHPPGGPAACTLHFCLLSCTYEPVLLQTHAQLRPVLNLLYFFISPLLPSLLCVSTASAGDMTRVLPLVA